MPKQVKIKNEHNETLKAGCVIVNEKNEVLLVTDRGRKNWAFPKGHTETGETLEQTALREVQEETGYDIEIVKKLADIGYTNGQTGELVRLTLFQAKPLKIFTVAERGIYSMWFSFDEARKLLHRDLGALLDIVET